MKIRRLMVSTFAKLIIKIIFFKVMSCMLFCIPTFWANRRISIFFFWTCITTICNLFFIVLSYFMRTTINFCLFFLVDILEILQFNVIQLSIFKEQSFHRLWSIFQRTFWICEKQESFLLCCLYWSSSSRPCPCHSN